MSSDTNVPETNISEPNLQEAEIMGMKPNTYCMLLHLSQILNFCAMPCGIIVPIVLWILNKNQSPQVDLHGKIILNWQISLFVYMVACVMITVTGFIFSIFMAVATGIPLRFGVILAFPVGFVLGILALVFPIIGALKANEGTVWKYPLSIQFFK